MESGRKKRAAAPAAPTAVTPPTHRYVPDTPSKEQLQPIPKPIASTKRGDCETLTAVLMVESNLTLANPGNHGVIDVCLFYDEPNVLINVE
mmetsp:Transcript_55465/g.113427  ORF Transcript_55465/g.113427 Transcript_55465/m.113427 type:complete len:91 (+) Transcript_55465:1209-1481(+)